MMSVVAMTRGRYLEFPVSLRRRLTSFSNLETSERFVPHPCLALMGCHKPL